MMEKKLNLLVYCCFFLLQFVHVCLCVCVCECVYRLHVSSCSLVSEEGQWIGRLPGKFGRLRTESTRLNEVFSQKTALSK